jgi:hypothetical protein
MLSNFYFSKTTISTQQNIIISMAALFNMYDNAIRQVVDDILLRYLLEKGIITRGDVEHALEMYCKIAVNIVNLSRVTPLITNNEIEQIRGSFTIPGPGPGNPPDHYTFNVFQHHYMVNITRGIEVGAWNARPRLHGRLADLQGTGLAFRVPFPPVEAAMLLQTVLHPPPLMPPYALTDFHYVDEFERIRAHVVSELHARMLAIPAAVVAAGGGPPVPHYDIRPLVGARVPEMADPHPQITSQSSSPQVPPELIPLEEIPPVQEPIELKTKPVRQEMVVVPTHTINEASVNSEIPSDIEYDFF